MISPTKILITTIVIVIIIVVGILIMRGSSNSSPSATVEAFYKAINKGDFNNAEMYVNPTSAINNFLPGGGEPSSFINGIKEVKVEKEVSRGDMATVVVRLILKPELRERSKSSFFGDSDWKKWERGVKLMLSKVNGKWIIITIHTLG